jgi:hypothetical protein
MAKDKFLTWNCYGGYCKRGDDGKLYECLIGLNSTKIIEGISAPIKNFYATLQLSDLRRFTCLTYAVYEMDKTQASKLFPEGDLTMADKLEFLMSKEELTRLAKITNVSSISGEWTFKSNVAHHLLIMKSF